KLKMHTGAIAVGFENCADAMLNGDYAKNFDDLLIPYLRAATGIKHQGFIEEREVRIVVSPITPEQIEASVEAVRLSFAKAQIERPNASYKSIHSSQTGRRYVALFEGLGE